jgi:hypothetical protein
MTLRRIDLRCECGRKATHIREIGFTGEHDLAIFWRCSFCKQLVSLVKPLADCWREAALAEPYQPNKQRATSDPARKYDQTFLKRLHVKLPEEDAPFSWDPPTAD